MRRALLIALCCAAAARAQEEPTPFWMPPPPPKKEAPKPAKKKKPVQIEPLEMKGDRKPKPPAAQKPPKKTPPPEEPGAPVPTWIEPPPQAAEPSPRPKHAPLEVEPEAAPKPRAPAATLPPAPEPQRAPVQEPPAAQKPPAVVAPAPLVPRELPRLPEPQPEQPPAIVAEPEPEPAPSAEARTLSFGASLGSWAKSGSDGSGRAWQLAYGVRAAFAIFPSLEAEIELVRAGATAGSPFVNASTTHNLAALRGFYVIGDRLALLLGGGAGITLVQTHYTLQPSTDFGTVPTGIDATAIKPVIQVTAAGRARVFRGLEVRAEVSAIARDGRLDLLPLLGVGWSF